MNEINYKQKALEHVRGVCPELMELSEGCKVEYKGQNGVYLYTSPVNTTPNPSPLIFFNEGLQYVRQLGKEYWRDKKEELKIIGHTPHLEHWLRGIEKNMNIFDVTIENDECFISMDGNFPTKKPLPIYNLTADDQSEEFYKVYCDIVGI